MIKILLTIVFLLICQTGYSGEYSVNAIARVNELRMERGLEPFLIDEVLQKEAEEISVTRATRGRGRHLWKKKWGYARAEGVGKSSDVDWAGQYFTTCHLYTTEYKYAGAGIAVNRGETFYTLRLR